MSDPCHRANNFAASRKKVREARYRLRDVAARLLPEERVAKCGRHPISAAVDFRNGVNGAYVGGVVTCGSVWTCPNCAAKIAEARRQELDEVIAAHMAAGGSVYMTALTVRHNRGQGCADLKRVVSDTWSKVLASRAYRRLRDDLGGVRWVRALEITHGDNGWHPHLHVLFFLPPGVGEDRAAEFGIEVFEQWAKRIDKTDYGPCNPEIYSFERAECAERAGDYVTKWGSARELTHGHLKIAKGGGASPWQLLVRAEKGDKRARWLFREYAAAFKGARHLTWSKGLREAYGLREAKSEEEAALDDPEERAPLIGQLSKHVYRRVQARGLVPKVLDVIEDRADWSAVLVFLRGQGIDAFEPPPDRFEPPPHMDAVRRFRERRNRRFSRSDMRGNGQ